MKPFKKLTKSTKAMAPIVADLLVLAIVVALMSVVWVFALTYTANYQNGQGGAMLERIVVEDVRFYKNGANNAVNITIYNYGKLPINIILIEIQNTVCPTFKMYNKQGSEVISQIDVGTICRLNAILASSLVPVSGNVYTITLITQRDYSITGSYAAPVT
jgi:hypothetical protein